MILAPRLAGFVAPIALLSVLQLAGAPASWAQPRDRSATALANHGVKLFNQADFDRSLAVLKQALERTREPRLLSRIWLYIGLNHAIQGQAATADQAFRRALVLDPSHTIHRDRFDPAVVRRFDAVREQLRGHLRLSSDVEDAVAWVDGSRVGRLPQLLRLAIGRHRVRIAGPDGNDFETNVVVAVDATVKVEAPLARAADSVAPSPAATRAPRGRSQRRIWAWVAAGGALAAAGAGLGLYLSAASQADEGMQIPDDTPQGAAKRDELSGAITTKQVVAGILAGVAVGLSATSIYLFVSRGDRRRSATGDGAGIALVPAVFPLTGAVVVGRY